MSTRAEMEMGHKGLHICIQFATVYQAFASCGEARDVLVMLVLDNAYISVSVSQSGCQCQAATLSPSAIVLSSHCLGGLHGLL